MPDANGGSRKVTCRIGGHERGSGSYPPPSAGYRAPTLVEEKGDGKVWTVLVGQLGFVLSPERAKGDQDKALRSANERAAGG
jgi:hypothetical protein